LRSKLTRRTLVVDVDIIIILILQELGIFFLFRFSMSIVTVEKDINTVEGFRISTMTSHSRCFFTLSTVFRLLRFEHLGKSWITIFLTQGSCQRNNEKHIVKKTYLDINKVLKQLCLAKQIRETLHRVRQLLKIGNVSGLLREWRGVHPHLLLL
jgi:hypothetical protein